MSTHIPVHCLCDWADPDADGEVTSTTEPAVVHDDCLVHGIARPLTGEDLVAVFGRESVSSAIDDLDPEARAALQLIPIAREFMDDLRDRLPEGMDFGIFLIVKPPPGQKEGRNIVLTTDRDRVAPQVALWVLDVLGPKPGEPKR